MEQQQKTAQKKKEPERKEEIYTWRNLTTMF